MIQNYDQAAHLSFVEGQAASISREIYTTKYASIQYRELIPVDTSSNPWATHIIHYSENYVGRAQFLANRGTDFPTSAIERTQHSVRIEDLTSGMEWTEQEINQARLVGRPLRASLTRASVRAMEDFIDQTALYGNADFGWDGFLNNPNVPVKTAVKPWKDAAGATNATGLEMAAEVNNAISGVWTDSLQVEMADTVLMSTDRYSLLATTPMGDNNPNMVVMRWLMRNNVFTMQTGRPVMFRVCRQLDTAGSGNTERMCAYRRHPEVVRFHFPMPLRFFPVQRTGLLYKVPGLARIGGTEVRLPEAIRYVDNI